VLSITQAMVLPIQIPNNYLIPVDVGNADNAEIWTNSVDLREIVNRLREQSPDAMHYVIFDACREELHLTREGTKALERKGFVPVANVSGVMIAYATAPGQNRLGHGSWRRHLRQRPFRRDRQAGGRVGDDVS